ncbi:MAG: PorV/PorQ family protein [Candidatus Eisenbacteria bacterium]|uniref:PorV/PorQ family protein n=1 Tax=Eiseniibacteriota bacterium TaxID=2212470 RepID=A0A948RV62_UNCEI|nr:PorV/PorQ family protein [Candidatus Eisenbacteria bacterium]MBU1948235.1 PorV/PorQ family protein [Candidatus Eisenbacteria bacterium]MBU2690571.1 PorV/PorQ family protein [Candidatus Eisenbacteria bacterium]
MMTFRSPFIHGLRTSILVVALLMAAVPVLEAQTDLGGQRVGTASGTFLKIPFSARGAALGGAYAALVTGPEAVFINPAGLSLQEGSGVAVGFVQWPADLTITSAVYSHYHRGLDMHLAIFGAGMHTTMTETTEFNPLGIDGREFSFSDWVAGLSMSRHFTDRLTIGVGIRYFRENLGTEIGGPSINAVLFDAGNIYRLGFRAARLAFSINNFGGDLRPGGSYVSSTQGTEIRYAAFSAPTLFRLSFAIDTWRRNDQVLWMVTEIQNHADNEETFIGGMEYGYGNILTLRAGYNFNSDVFRLGLGGGLKTEVGGNPLALDYAYSDGDYLGDVHHWSLTFNF